MSGQFTSVFFFFSEICGLCINFCLISVKRKGDTLSEIAMIEDGTNFSEVEEIVERQPVITGMKLLANEEFEKEEGAYESEPEEDEPDQLEDILPAKTAPDMNSKKRKRSNKPESSKYGFYLIVMGYNAPIV